MPIRSFSDRESLSIFEAEYSKKAEKKLPVELWEKARNVLEALHSAENLNDLKLYDLDHKKGNLKGVYSLKINAQYRVLFEWDDGEAHNVSVGDPDYH